MKEITMVDGRELQQAVIAMMLKRPSMAGRFIGGVFLIADAAERDPSLRIRCNVIHFDTEKGAIEYNEKPDKPPVDLGQPITPEAVVAAAGNEKPEGGK